MGKFLEQASNFINYHRLKHKSAGGDLEATYKLQTMLDKQQTDVDIAESTTDNAPLSPARRIALQRIAAFLGLSLVAFLAPTNSFAAFYRESAKKHDELRPAPEDITLNRVEPNKAVLRSETYLQDFETLSELIQEALNEAKNYQQTIQELDRLWNKAYRRTRTKIKTEYYTDSDGNRKSRTVTERETYYIEPNGMTNYHVTLHNASSQAATLFNALNAGNTKLSRVNPTVLADHTQQALMPNSDGSTRQTMELSRYNPVAAQEYSRYFKAGKYPVSIAIVLGAAMAYRDSAAGAKLNNWLAENAPLLSSRAGMSRRDLLRPATYAEKKPESESAAELAKQGAKIFVEDYINHLKATGIFQALQVGLLWKAFAENRDTDVRAVLLANKQRVLTQAHAAGEAVRALPVKKLQAEFFTDDGWFSQDIPSGGTLRGAAIALAEPQPKKSLLGFTEELPTDIVVARSAVVSALSGCAENMDALVSNTSGSEILRDIALTIKYAELGQEMENFLLEPAKGNLKYLWGVVILQALSLAVPSHHAQLVAGGGALAKEIVEEFWAKIS